MLYWYYVIPLPLAHLLQFLTAEAARIAVFVDGAPAENQMPGEMIFYTTSSSGVIGEIYRNTAAKILQFASGSRISMNLTTEDNAFVNYQATIDADATSAISSNTTSGAVTHHIQIEINGTTGWIAVSTTDPTA